MKNNFLKIFGLGIIACGSCLLIPILISILVGSTGIGLYVQYSDYTEYMEWSILFLVVIGMGYLFYQYKFRKIQEESSCSIDCKDCK